MCPKQRFFISLLVPQIIFISTNKSEIKVGFKKSQAWLVVESRDHTQKVTLITPTPPFVYSTFEHHQNSCPFFDTSILAGRNIQTIISLFYYYQTYPSPTWRFWPKFSTPFAVLNYIDKNYINFIKTLIQLKVENRSQIFIEKNKTKC